MSPLAKPSATREVLERHGLQLKKSLGQNFLVNDDVIRKIIELSGVDRRDTVLEIGPGIGTLTYALLGHAASVVAIERDPKLPEVLADTLGPINGGGCRFTLIEGDAVDVIDAGLSASGYSGTSPTKLISNLPYAVAATVVLDVFEKMPSVKSATVMVQREVAERMRARPGSKIYGAYSVKLAFYACYVDSFNVAPSNFMPPPHVDSTVIRFDRRVLDVPSSTSDAQSCVSERKPADVDGGDVVDRGDGGKIRIEAFAPAPQKLIKTACMMADAAFFARRKTIANSMRQYFAGRDKTAAQALPEVFSQAGIDPSVRGETLTLDDYLRLAQSFEKVIHAG